MNACIDFREQDYDILPPVIVSKVLDRPGFAFPRQSVGACLVTEREDASSEARNDIKLGPANRLLNKHN
jgi:hypothetical protein